jgi:hypothetical protein
MGLTTSYHEKYACYENSERASDLGGLYYFNIESLHVDVWNVRMRYLVIQIDLVFFFLRILLPYIFISGIISGINLVGSSRDSFTTSGASMGRCYACGQATYPTLPLGPSGATVAPTPLVPCPTVGGFLPVSSSPPAPPIGVSAGCFQNETSFH